jgi:hypothetical protein
LGYDNTGFIPIALVMIENRGVIDMRAHSQTINHRPHVGVRVNVGGVDWFQRLCQWLKSFTQQSREIGPVSPYGTWDAKRERFQPLRADGAVDLEAERNGASWASKIYSASI